MNKINFMDKDQIAPARIKKRIFAFIIDIFIVYFLRFFYIHLALQFWLMRYVMDFLHKYEQLFGKVDFNRITNVEIDFFSKSDLFIQIKWFVVGLFIIPIFYNMVLFFTKWSATIGQKLVNIRVVSKNGSEMKFYQIIARSIALMIPWLFSFFVVLNQYLVIHKIGNPLNNTSLIIFMMIFLSWYDLAVLTKNKLVFHDYITRTRVVEDNVANFDGKSSIFKRLFVINFVEEFRKFKNNIKRQFEKAKEIKEKYKK